MGKIKTCFSSALGPFNWHRKYKKVFSTANNSHIRDALALPESKRKL